MAGKADKTDRNDIGQQRDAVLATGGLPVHVAVIMDGNGRWAKKRFLPRVAGHRAGRYSVRRTVEACARLGVGYLTLYTFSQENWKRPADEVNALWAFLEEAILAERDELDRQNIKLTATGELDIIPGKTKASLDQAMDSLASNTGMVLNLALAYGGRTEIVRATQTLAARAKAGDLEPDEIDEDIFASALYNAAIPDPDLVIRTSGEYRLSNFLIWQTAYAEIFFTDTLWPDFGEADLLEAIADYQKRERRFGGVGSNDRQKDGSKPSRSPFNLQRWKDFLKVRG
jgi:undecaprenyl diphosphate synthase